LSSIQKTNIGANPFSKKGLAVSILIGGIFGLIIRQFLFKNMQLIRQLRNANLLLEEKVKERTKKLNEQNKLLEEISNTDSLTSVANRRFLDLFLSIECKRLSRNTSSLSLIMCDIDHFKIFNDIYGHQAGDECLKKVAVALLSLARRGTDCVARYGGEEFIIVLPDTKIELAVHVAETARKAVENLCIPHEKPAKDKIVTMSFGVASISSEDRNYIDPSILISKADDALYMAKEAGRNRVIESKII